jgi:hypothetical protein
MNSNQLRIETRKFRRFRNFGDIAPYCRLCGKFDWRYRYEHHQIAGRKYSAIVILICVDCHDWISDMQKDRPQLPAGIDPQVAELVHQMYGQIEIAERSIECWKRSIGAILGVVTVANENEVPEGFSNPEGDR